jgi:hypothetical protein
MPTEVGRRLASRAGARIPLVSSPAKRGQGGAVASSAAGLTRAAHTRQREGERRGEARRGEERRETRGERGREATERCLRKKMTEKRAKSKKTAAHVSKFLRTLGNEFQSNSSSLENTCRAVLEIAQKLFGI